MSEIKDSGSSSVFQSGAVRDAQEGKGRCDLLPFDSVCVFLGADQVIHYIGEFMKDGDASHLLNAARTFAKNCPDFHNNVYEAVLEYACQLEGGANKYGERNWELGIPVNRFIDSGVRHYLKYKRGDRDERHDRAFMWNMLCAHHTIVNNLNNK